MGIAQMIRDELVVYCYDNAPEVYSQIKAHHTASDIFKMLYQGDFEAVAGPTASRTICPDCGADIVDDGSCWYCENKPT